VIAQASHVKTGADLTAYCLKGRATPRNRKIEAQIHGMICVAMAALAWHNFRMGTRAARMAALYARSVEDAPLAVAIKLAHG
jgi:hypothetical protein